MRTFKSIILADCILHFAYFLQTALPKKECTFQEQKMTSRNFLISSTYLGAQGAFNAGGLCGGKLSVQTKVVPAGFGGEEKVDNMGRPLGLPQPHAIQ